MRSILKYFLKTFLFLFIFVFLYLNIALYQNPTIFQSKQGITNQDLYEQLLFLKSEFNQGAAFQMQHLFPEGFIFFQALYALAWHDMAYPLEKNHPIYLEAIHEIDQVIINMSTNEATQIFSKSLPLEYGAFYKGWTSYIMGKRLSLQADLLSDSLLIQQFQNNCSQIKNTIHQSPEPYLESYENATWPADNILCLASLDLHDKIFAPQFSSTIETWISLIQIHLDPKTQLIPHAVYANSNRVREGARGSSQSLMHNFLLDIHPEFAKEQFKIYKKRFVDYRFGLPGIREYPKGTFGGGDIDSGPVILQIGGAASIVGMRALMRHGEFELGRSIQSSVDAFGIALTFNQKKRYLFGALPMADAFIAWGNGLNSLTIKQHISFKKTKFHFISLLVVFVVLFFILKI